MYNFIVTAAKHYIHYTHSIIVYQTSILLEMVVITAVNMFHIGIRMIDNKVNEKLHLMNIIYC